MTDSIFTMTPYISIITKHYYSGNGASRFSATTYDNKKKVRIARDYSISMDDNHKLAAKELAEKIGIRGEFIGGYIGNSKYAFICKEITKEG